MKNISPIELYSEQNKIPYQLMSQKCESFHAGFQELYLRPIEISTEY